MKTAIATSMHQEAREAADVVARQLKRNAPVLDDLAARLRRHPPRCIVTAARGSADRTAAKDAFAHVAALLNVEQAPLADIADTVIPLCAGPERSVAATKSHLATLAAVLQFTAAWSGDAALHTALARLPDDLRRGWEADWSALAEGPVPAEHLFVVGRRDGYGAALEAALKLKETCGLHAALARGHDPDVPPHLNKVTETV